MEIRCADCFETIEDLNETNCSYCGGKLKISELTSYDMDTRDAGYSYNNEHYIIPSEENMQKLVDKINFLAGIINKKVLGND